MVKNLLYKRYISQIAGLFCKEDVFCSTTLKERLINLLDDKTFKDSFLPNLAIGRFYVHHYSNLGKRSNTSWYIDTTFYDLITSERVAGTWSFNTNPNRPKLELRKLLLSYGFNIVQGAPLYTDANITADRIVHKPSKEPGYGISFIPRTAIDPPVPTPGSPPSRNGNGGYVGLTPSPPSQDGNGEEDEGTEVGFDIKKLLIPALLAATYFLIG